MTILGFALPGDPHLQAKLLNSALVQFPVIGSQLTPQNSRFSPDVGGGAGFEVAVRVNGLRFACRRACGGIARPAGKVNVDDARCTDRRFRVRGLLFTDGIVQFAYEPREPVDRRWLRVRKLRGAHHLGGKHSFDIAKAGITVYPRLETVAIAPSDEPLAGKRFSSGIARLDELMGGGGQVGDATAILGPSGSGKTIACLHYVVLLPLPQRDPHPLRRDRLGDPARNQRPQDARLRPRRGRMGVHGRRARARESATSWKG